MGTMAAISFVHLPMFGALALLSLPIVAHLFGRRARRRIVFPSIRLLYETAASQSKMFRLRRWLLLVLRCLAAALIVTAFAQPMWQSGAALPPDAEQGASVVLLVDTSASMAQQADGISAMEKMRAAGGRALDGLRAGADGANVVYASARPHAAFGALTANLDALRGELARAAPGSDRADLAGAFALAGKMLAAGSGPRHLVVLSDMQATNWANLWDRLSADRPLPDDVHLTLVPLDGSAPGNIALSQPMVLPRTPRTGAPAQISVMLTNFSSQPRNVRVNLTVNRRRIDSGSVTLGPQQRQSVTFEVTFDAAGEHEAVLSIPDDALGVDNQAYLVVRTAAALPVVIVSDDDPDEPASSSYYLMRALAPFGNRRDAYAVRVVTGRAVTTAAIENAEGVLVADVAALSAGALKALTDYMHRGGGVVMFCGRGPVTANLTGLNEAAGQNVLPWAPGAPRDLNAGDAQLHLADGDWASPLLRDFDPRHRQALAQIQFHRIWSTGPVHGEAQVRLRYSDGTPALAVRAVGRGKLVVANFGCAVHSSDLGKYGSFVALMHNLVRSVQSRIVAADGATVGAPMRFAAPGSIDADAGELNVQAPDGSGVTDAAFELATGSLSVQLARAERPGFYRLEQGGRTLATAAANLDPRESDLRRTPPADLTRLLQQHGLGVEVRDATGAESIADVRGRPLWGWMIVAAMIVLGIELALVAYWKR